jgi:histidyl-tRNA synthetase
MQNAKGTIDYNKNSWNKISNIIDVIRDKVKTLNVDEIDTPILENTDLLLKKYGDDAENKLIFNLQDGTSLRYDLTVPLIRYFCNNGLENMRRFQIGKVFRKDNPEVENGRFREFYQADLDIIGNYEPLISEIEIFWLINSVLKELRIQEYTIKYNYRENLYDMCKK